MPWRSIYILCVYVTCKHGEIGMEVETLLLVKIIFPPYKTPKYPCTEQRAHQISSFPKDSSPSQPLLGTRNLPWSHKQSSMLPLSFSPILAFLFLLQYLKTYGEQLLNISQWIKMKRLILREVLLMHFFFLYCCCFSPLAHMLLHVLPAVNERSICTPDGSACPVMNCTTLPPSRPFSNQPHPLPHTQPLDAAGVWEQSGPSPPLLTYNQTEGDVIIAEAKRLTLFKSKL